MHDPTPVYFTLQIGACFCRCDVRINDIPVFSHDLSGSRADIEIPLNPLVFTGENSLAVRVLPALSAPGGPSYDLGSDHVECSAELMRRDGAEGPRVSLASVIFRGGGDQPFAASSADSDLVSPLQSTYDAQHFAAGARAVTLTTPFPEWRWRAAPPIDPGPVTLSELIREHQTFWALLRGKDIHGIRAALSVNARDLQSAYYLRDVDHAHQLIGIESLLNNPEATLKAMPADVRLELFASDRLARLATSDGDSPIYFHEGDSGLDAHIGAWFCKAPAGGWVMVR